MPPMGSTNPDSYDGEGLGAKFWIGLVFAVIALMILLPRGPGASAVLSVFIGGVLLVAVTAARVPRRWVIRISVVVALVAGGSVLLILALGDTAETAGLGMTTLLVVAV